MLSIHSSASLFVPLHSLIRLLWPGTFTTTEVAVKITSEAPHLSRIPGRRKHKVRGTEKHGGQKKNPSVSNGPVIWASRSTCLRGGLRCQNWLPLERDRPTSLSSLSVRTSSSKCRALQLKGERNDVDYVALNEMIKVATADLGVAAFFVSFVWAVFT